MIALKLTGIKQFMSHLLLADTFDQYLFIDGEIVTFNTFTIDGYIQKDFFEPDAALPQYSAWITVKDYALTVIKGKKTPLSFKFVFCLSPEQTESFLKEFQPDYKSDDIQGLYLNIRYHSDVLSCVTGTSMKTFTLDKSLEQSWDRFVLSFFAQQGILFEQES